MGNKKSRIKNYQFPIGQSAQGGNAQANTTFNAATGIDTSPKAIQRNLGNIISPVQLDRIAQNIGRWRDAIKEAELAYYPHRVQMQRIYIDTELNGHVFSCMERRRDLTLLRKFEFYTGTSEAPVIDKELTEWFSKQTWFSDFRQYAHDAIYFGYSLISLGDIVDTNFKDVDIIKRWNISPDRMQVVGLIYSLTGLSWEDPRFSDWHVYVKTTSSSGSSKCGFGLLYKVALYEILLRNILGYNADFIELYAQPYRIGRTTKTTESERAELEAALQAMGSAGYAVIDPLDEIEFLESNLGGTGWQGYDNFEQRLEKKISKIILGHADAMDSIPGKLGNDGEKSPAQKALEDKQTKDGKLDENVVNNELIPRMRNLGFPLPEGIMYRLRNDAEIEETRSRENAQNTAVATIAQTMKNAGLKMSAKYFTERTGIPAEEVEEVVAEPTTGMPGDKNPGAAEKKANEKIKARLERLYGGHDHAH